MRLIYVCVYGYVYWLTGVQAMDPLTSKSGGEREVAAATVNARDETSDPLIASEGSETTAIEAHIRSERERERYAQTHTLSLSLESESNGASALRDTVPLRILFGGCW